MKGLQSHPSELDKSAVINVIPAVDHTSLDRRHQTINTRYLTQTIHDTRSGTDRKSDDNQNHKSKFRAEKSKSKF